MKNLIQTFKQKNNKIPIWFMRQAGRYLPEYMEIRSNISNFLDLCYDSEKASIVTLQPITRYGFDAAIIFSDILVVPHALGWDVKFAKGEGPILKKFTSSDDLRLIENGFSAKVNNIYDTVSKTKALLPKETSLFGFAGSPWTVISYMLEGRGKQDFSVSKNFLYDNNALAEHLFAIITERTIEYLSGQIEAGADIIQLFDSWAGKLNGFLYDQFVIEPTRKIVSKIKEKYPHIPIIGFPKGSGYNYDKYIAKLASKDNQSGIDGISVDQFTPVSQMKKWQKEIIVQGNLDPVILLGKKDNIKRSVDEILMNIEHNNFIFNLGHGIMPTTPPENVEYLVNYVREFKR